MVKAIILVGGRSSRMPGETLKQYRRVNDDKMLVTYSIETFIRSSKVDSITVVVEEEAWEDLIRGDIAKRGLPLDKLQAPFWKARIYNRQSSVVEGIKASYDWRSFREDDISDEDIVIVHDASRPGITAEMIDKCLEALSDSDGAVLVNNLNEQTPVAFNAKKYYMANMELVNKVDFDSIDELSMPTINGGMNVKKIDGYDNPNIDDESDFIAFEEKMRQAKVS